MIYLTTVAIKPLDVQFLNQKSATNTTIDTRDGMIHQCIAVLQYDTGIDTTFNVSIYVTESWKMVPNHT